MAVVEQRKARYYFDSTKDILCKYIRGEGLECRSKGDPNWVKTPNPEFRYEEYGKAFFLGEGAWREMEDISEERANKILNSWKEQERV